MPSNEGPRLRRVQASSGNWQGQPVVILQDPLGLSDRAIAVPRAIAPILELCDGSRDSATLRAALELRSGLRVGPDYMDRMLADLDDALLLDNERFVQAYRSAVKEFRAAPWRQPRLAGTVYPADSEWAGRTLEEYLNVVSQGKGTSQESRHVRGLVSPHIDYQRGAAVYADVWQQAAAAARSAEIVIILGTNHFDSHRLLTLTQQSYCTPWGVLPTAREVVDEVASALGEEEAFAEELHHRDEHSVEIAAVWLHYLVKDHPCQLVPVLCGSFQKFIETEESPGEDEGIAVFVDAIGRATSNRRVVVVAAGDLAHVGPAFGDNYPIDLTGRAKLSAADHELMAQIACGDAEAMFAEVKREGDRRRVCGLAPIYVGLRLLGETTGEVTGYAQCPADPQETSFVSICGIVLS